MIKLNLMVKQRVVETSVNFYRKSKKILINCGLLHVLGKQVKEM